MRFVYNCSYPSGKGHKARVIDGFNSSDEEKLMGREGVDFEEREFLRVFEEVNNALYSKQTRSKLNVDAAPQFLAFTSSSASSILPSLFKLIIVAAISIVIL